MGKGSCSGKDQSLQIRVLLLPREGLRWLTNDLGLGRLGVHFVLCLQRLERLPQLQTAQNQPDCCKRPETVWKLFRKGSPSCTNITHKREHQVRPMHAIRVYLLRCGVAGGRLLARKCQAVLCL